MNIRIEKIEYKDITESQFLELSNFINAAYINLIEDERNTFSKECVDNLMANTNVKSMKNRLLNRKIFFAYDVDKVIGIVSFNFQNNIVKTFFIHPNYQNKNIGRRLFTELLETVDSDVITIGGAFQSAVDFYIKLGFTCLNETTAKTDIGDTTYISYGLMMQLPKKK